MSTQTTIEWVRNLPSRGASTRRDAVAFVDALKTRPNTWAVYKRLPAGKRWTSHHQYAVNHPGTEWTARTVRNRTTVYARWVGTKKGA